MTMTKRELDNTIKSFGGKKVFSRKLNEYKDDLAFIRNHREELLNEYDDSWIAVCKAKIIASDKNYQQLTKKINTLGLSPKNLVIKRISSKKVVTLF